MLTNRIQTHKTNLMGDNYDFILEDKRTRIICLNPIFDMAY